MGIMGPMVYMEVPGKIFSMAVTVGISSPVMLGMIY